MCFLVFLRGLLVLVISRNQHLHKFIIFTLVLIQSFVSQPFIILDFITDPPLPAVQFAYLVLFIATIILAIDIVTAIILLLVISDVPVILLLIDDSACLHRPGGLHCVNYVILRA